MSRFWRNVATNSTLSGLGAIAGILFYALIIARAGINGTSDAFFIAYSIPSIFYAILITSQQVYISTFSRLLTQYKKSDADQIINVVITISIPILISIVLFSYWLAPEIISVIAWGMNHSAKMEAVRFLEIMSALPLLNGAALIFSAQLVAKERFLFFASQNLVRYSVTFMYAFMTPEQGLYGIAIGLIIGSLTQLVVVLGACVFQIRYYYKPTIFLTQKLVIKTMAGMIWTTIQTSLLRQITPISTRLIGSFLAPGSITLLELANRIQGPITTVFFGSIISSQLPSLARTINTEKRADIISFFKTSWRRLTLVSVPIVTILLAINSPLLFLLFKWGNTTSENIVHLIPLVIAYNVGLYFRCYYSLVLSYFYAANLSKDLLWNNMLITVVDVIAKIIFAYWFGAIGVAIAYSLSIFISLLWGITTIARNLDTAAKSLITVDIRLILLAIIALIVGYFISGTALSIDNISTDFFRYLLATVLGTLLPSILFVSYYLMKLKVFNQIFSK